ncbi:UPF0764 protein C16orf89 [Liparis tanakae]|uniref:UPF0764 protein C16orf89 n=1 Tax=Liparis tanakae TaxID=230148 RepID=A0A4Z2E258_9TELE|nr:UPF0764 protein C16orf89 [Liparis tanakae]
MNGTPCIVTKPCRDTMTQFGCPHYSLSHQLLYFLIGRMVRSFRKLKSVGSHAGRGMFRERRSGLRL